MAVAAPPVKPIGVKVVVVTMFDNEFPLWVEREHLDRPVPAGAAFHDVRLSKDGILGMITGMGTAKAAASIMAVGLDPRFDFSKAYWIVAGIGGGDPADVSLGSAVWANHVIDGDLAYEVDAREIPQGWTTGYVPLRKSTPFEEPVRSPLEGEMYTLDGDFVNWAFELTRNTAIPDTEALKTSRQRFSEYPNALRPPFVARGDDLSSSTFWHGGRMDRWANDWVRYFTGGAGNYMVSAMEDTGTMQSLTFLAQAGRVDLRRVLVLRTVSNYDREAPDSTPAQSLKTMFLRQYSGMGAALESAELVGDCVVRYLVTHWSECANRIPGSKN